MNSPLFPAARLTLPGPSHLRNGADVLIPQLPDKPLSQTLSLQVYIIPAENHLFVQGFEPHEYENRPPTLLRGCLLIRVLKPTKLKLISLLFKGTQRTEWPEGIPPKKSQHQETNTVVNHTWPFLASGQAPSAHNNADFFRDANGHTFEGSGLRLPSHLPPRLLLLQVAGDTSFSFTRSLSPATFMKRNASPADMARSETSSLGVSTGTGGGDFVPGDYIYNFEHPIHPGIPELCSVTFGNVSYYLEAVIGRTGAFKPNLTAKLAVSIVRTPSSLSLEENEPIVITRDWEDQLRYEIVVGGKLVVLDLYLPLAFRFVPLWGKVQLHRIRVYITENMEYYCNNKKVHRLEPQKKYLLLEHKATKGRLLLGRNPQAPGLPTPEEDEILARELEFQLFVPLKFPNKPGLVLHPDTSFENIQVHHWIKICLRISRMIEGGEKRKHYEISIDLPIHILSPLAAHGNTLLPAYDDGTPALAPLLPHYTQSPPMSPGVVPVDYTSPRGLERRGLPLTTLLVSQAPSFEFVHINLLVNNDEPIEREADMHLESNLYKPDAMLFDAALQLPQATPAFSPLMTPIQRPIRLLRKPSVNPPPFSADTPPPPMELLGLPPAYEERDPLLSPLRIDDRSTLPPARVRSLTTIAAALLGESAPEQSGLRGMLLGAIDSHPRPSSTPEPAPELEGDQISLSLASTIPSDPNTLPSEATAPEVPELKHPPPPLVPEEDLADSPSSPITLPLAMRALSPIRRSHLRRSLISLETSEYEIPVEQTVPLLTLSQTLLNIPLSDLAFGYRQGNVLAGLLNDWEMRQPRPPFEPMLTIMDLGEVPVDMKLLQLRNPRVHPKGSPDEELELKLPTPVEEAVIT